VDDLAKNLRRGLNYNKKPPNWAALPYSNDNISNLQRNVATIECQVLNEFVKVHLTNVRIHNEKHNSSINKRW